MKEVKELLSNWNKSLNDGTIQTHESSEVYKKSTLFDYSKFIKVEEPLDFNKDKLNDLISKKVKKIFITISGDFMGIFQLLDDTNLDINPETQIESENYDSFFGSLWAEDKNIHYGTIDIIQHQEVSVEWFIEILKLKKSLEESGEYIEEDNSITGFLNWYCDMVAFADESGLNADPGEGWEDEEMGLKRHGVSLSFCGNEIACAASISENIGGDIEEDVYFSFE